MQRRELEAGICDEEGPTYEFERAAIREGAEAATTVGRLSLGVEESVSEQLHDVQPALVTGALIFR